MRPLARRTVQLAPRAAKYAAERPSCAAWNVRRPFQVGVIRAGSRCCDGRRSFHSTSARAVVKPYLLADIGEGITECQIIQWFVQPGARVEQFDKICEVQSDKASVEITSRFDGVIKKLHYEADDMAKVGKPLVDIDIQGSIAPEDEPLTNTDGQAGGEASAPAGERSEERSERDAEPKLGQSSVRSKGQQASEVERSAQSADEGQTSRPEGKHAKLATPAVRHLTRQLNIDIADVPGSGREGRVLKEDVQRYASSRSATGEDGTAASSIAPDISDIPGQAEDTKPIPLTPIQNQMFKTMTRSLCIPHFLYTDTVDFSALTALRRKLNTAASSATTSSSISQPSSGPLPKLSALPFIVKAISLSLRSHPLLNSHLDTTTNPSKPTILQSPHHNIGLAIDTPSGLLVPVIRRVETLSVAAIGAEIARLSALARAGRLSAADLAGATFTVSNIGSIGGTAVAPVIVPPQVAILGIGRARAVPGFGPDGEVVRKEECVFSWSADHRVVDGALVARCAENVRGLLEDLERMLVILR